MKKIVFMLFAALMLSGSIQAQEEGPENPTNQPDADGRIIRGRDGTNHWQPYMGDADLSDYRHAPREAIERFHDLKYGIRIHWGIYSFIHSRESWGLTKNPWGFGESGTEGRSPLSYQGFYHELYKGWYPEKFDARAWTDMMVENGFKFFVFTTKHHDGFSMYDTKTLVTSRVRFFGEDAGSIEPCRLHYSIMETPFARDVTAELVAAARERGLGVGLYYSHPDWYDADFRFDQWNPNPDESYTPQSDPEAWNRFRDRHMGQIRELLTSYGTVDMLSLDMWFPGFAWDHMQEVARMARQLQPGCMLRWRGIGNYGDYHTPENYIPGDESQGTMAWQVIHTLSTRRLFSYEPDETYIRGGDWIVSKLIDIVSKGGNLMVGVGPDLTGDWHPKVLESLSYAGDWLEVNGEAIYGTRPCEMNQQGNVYYTRNKEQTVVYAISEGWPGNSLFVGHVRAKRGSQVYLLGHDGPLSWEKSKDGIVIRIPDELQDEANRPCRQAYAFKITGTQNP